MNSYLIAKTICAFLVSLLHSSHLPPPYPGWCGGGGGGGGWAIFQNVHIGGDLGQIGIMGGKWQFLTFGPLA